MTTVRSRVRPAGRNGPAAVRPPGRGLRLLRGLSGSLAAGLVVLAALLGVVQWFSGADTVPGPGTGLLVGHGLGAAVAVALQWLADHSRGCRAAVAALAVVAVVVGVLWAGWWM